MRRWLWLPTTDWAMSSSTLGDPAHVMVGGESRFATEIERADAP